MSDSKPILPSGLDGTIAVGFDAIKWDFCDDHIFNLSYRGGGTVSLPHRGEDKTYSVPDGMTVRALNDFDSTEVSIFKGVHCIDEERYSASIEASLGMNGVNASASSSLARSSKVETDDTKSTTTVSCYKRIYRLKRDQVGSLTPAFKDALKALPGKYAAKDAETFQSFFQKWGTHYLTEGSFGGDFVMTAVIDESVYDKLDTQDIKASVETSFNEGVANGSAKSSIEQSTMNSLHLDNKSTSIQFHAVGGDSDKEINDWMNSVDAAVEFLCDVLAVSTDAIRPVFDPIWKLAEPGARQDALRAAWSAYLPPDEQHDDDLPEPITTWSVNANNQVTTDGFLTVWTNVVNDGDGGSVYVISDTNSKPTTRRASLGVHRYDDHDEQFYPACLFTPVKALDYCQISYTPSWGTLANQIRFQPFPLGLGDWEALQFNTPYQGRDRDGFVVASIDYMENGNRGFVIGSQTVGGTMTDCAGTAVHWYEGNNNPSDVRLATGSFCMPVARKNDFQVRLTSTSGTIAGSAFFVSLGSTRVMQPVVIDDATVANQASTHGLVTAYIPPQSNPWMRYASFQILISRDQSFASPIVAASAVATGPYQGDDKVVPVCSATAIVPKGMWYKVVAQTLMFFEPEQTVTPKVMWIGIAPAKPQPSARATPHRH